MRNIIYRIQAITLIPMFLIYRCLLGKGTRDLIRADFYRYCEWQGREKTMFAFCMLFAELTEFRSIVYKRMGVWQILMCWLWRPQKLLGLCCDDIGPGLIIQHGYSTVVGASHIGKNCHINQCVNVVWNGDRQPWIGDNVTICVGACVVGGVRVGNNVTIGAGAVVVKDVPDNCVAVGNPARYLPR